MSLLEVRDLDIEFATTSGRVQAVSGVSFSAEPGETVVLLGPSGCGKTTVLRTVGGLVAPSSGTVRFEGRDVTGPGADRVMMFQEHSLYPWLTVAGNIAFGLRSSGAPRRQRDAAVADWIGRVQLTGAERRYPSELSGGMRQRVALARSLASGARMILMDEPFAALDAQTRVDMQEQLRALVHAESRSVLFVTHDIDEAIALGDRLIVMGTRPGRIVDELENPLAPDRGPGTFASPEYGRLKERISRLIREGRALRTP
ncbi:ABC transporter ATP-binding protein [Amnibacterium endophyticum]|uniref:ABC transporter ATP-binding protein n=1 Tax=Amnibacterium endophyticum TaxID=2109337 RepID=A0ABW4LH58_9MICO